LAQVADADIKLRALILSLPLYVRVFRDILAAPIAFFGKLDFGAADGLKRAVAFMVQGIAIAYVVLVIGLALPQSIAGWLATSAPLLSGSAQQLTDYVRRIERVEGALTPALAREWRKQPELMLVVRILPEDRFKRMVQLIRDLAQRNPDHLERAIKGPTTGERMGGRGYILAFFLAIDPRISGMFAQVQQVMDIGAKYEVKAHIEFLLRATIFWLLTSFVVLRFMPSRHDPQRKPGTFIIGAYLVGFLLPLIEAVSVLVNTYQGIFLASYIAEASVLLTDQVPSGLGLGAGSAVESLRLIAAGVLLAAAVAAMAMGAFVRGTQCAYGISRSRASLAAVVGLGLGFGGIELVSGAMLAVLSRSGLL